MINKSSLLAIKALAQLAQLPPEECAGAASIAKKIDAPPNYLGKILQALASTGLVVSQKGKGGGFKLGLSPRKISLFDIVSNVEDMDRWSMCFMGRKQCLDSSPCCLHARWKLVREANVEFLKSIVLYDLNH